MLHGCIPVVIQDDVDPVFATLLDWPSFSLRISEVRTASVLTSNCMPAAWT